ncbi:TIGR03571 family LLM class oxidoreductase [Xanthomonas arboricola pv. corylina]|uniref:TIGR03571 family LLM class oxidoreductase n=1 Tax=Xanthomonas arboricola TaxID=56448 RepID=UPI001BB067C6|nr:TIGR03571 family LLM class oxidoreductase [Xanthomonas arboricola]QUI81862.1 TIGR03571 family LLM class oxidoreductase [Xanthomonas arboricola pv. corylina]
MPIKEEISSALDLIRIAGGMTVGIELPLDNDWSADGECRRKLSNCPRGVPDLSRQEELVCQVDTSGFSAIWMRDVPVFDPLRFGDAGSVYDPFVNLGFLAAVTRNVALGTAAIVLPLRHPLLVAKAAASVDVLANGRLILGVATGDRPVEFPLMGVDFDNRGEIFRNSVNEIRSAWLPGRMALDGVFAGEDLQLLPKPWRGTIPMVIAGQGRQSPEWIARNMQGIFVYPGSIEAMAAQVASWRQLRETVSMDPGVFISAFHLDLDENVSLNAIPHRFGARIGRHRLVDELHRFYAAGVDHLVLHLRNSHRPLDEVLDELAREVLPQVLPSSAPL